MASIDPRCSARAFALALAFLFVSSFAVACRDDSTRMGGRMGGRDAGPVGPAAGGAEAGEISGPFAHENLAVYLILAPDDRWPEASPAEYLTLAEALERGEAIVHETGDVNRLEVEVKGGRPVFVQSGDVVKGGRQDRTLATDAILTAQMGRVPIDAYCVEQGRWAQRGDESAVSFHASSARLAQNSLKKAGNQAFGGGKQSEVWEGVNRQLQSLAQATGQQVADARSPSSFQLGMESPAVQSSVEPAIMALRDLPERDRRAIGMAYAIDGKLVSADVYASPALFAARYEALLRAAAVEAAAAPGGGPTTRPATVPPATSDVLAWLRAAEGLAAARAQAVNDRTRVAALEADGSSIYECRDASTGVSVHRGYMKE